MHVAFAADHAGFELKRLLLEAARIQGHEVQDLGTDGPGPVDYPDFARTLGRAVADRRADRGVLICGSGVGAAVAVNKIPGVRGGLCADSYSARQGVEHDDVNVLVLGARVTGVELAKDLMRIYLAARFSGEERHRRRLEKVAALESECSA